MLPLLSLECSEVFFLVPKKDSSYLYCLALIFDSVVSLTCRASAKT